METRQTIEVRLAQDILRANKQETVISLELGVIRQVLLDIRDLLTSQKKPE